MKPGWIGHSLSLFVLLIIVTACLPPQQVRTDAQEGVEIEAIEVHDLPEMTEIVVRGQQSMIYTTFRLSDPPRLAVDMAGVRFGESVAEMEVNNGFVTTILPKQVEGTRISRLEVGLAEGLESNVRTEGGDLIIEVLKPLVAAVDEDVEDAEVIMEDGESLEELLPVEDQVSEPPVEEMSSVVESVPVDPVQPPEVPKVISTAKVIQGIEVVQDGGLRLVVRADGELSPEVFQLGSNRLVMDFKGVSTPLRRKLYPVSHDSKIRRFRMGKHEGKVRLVADLVEPVNYHVEQTAGQWVMRFGEAFSGPAPSPPEGMEPAPSVRVPPPATAPVSSPEGKRAPPVAPSQAAPVETEKAPMAPAPSEKPKTAESESVPVEKNQKREKQGEKPRAATEVRPLPRTTSNGVAPLERRFTGRRISLDFQDAEITNVIRLIADVSKLNIVVGDDVTGKVTLKLIGVPWDQALEIILKMNNLGQIREGNIVRIATLTNITRQQDEEAKAKETRIKAEDLSTQVFQVNYAKAKDLADPLKKSLSARGDITVDDRTNTMIVKDVQKNLQSVMRLAESLDTPTPQVMIEARIVQVNPNFNRALGIQWGGNFKTVSNSTLVGVQGTQGGTGPGGIAFGSTAPDFAVNLPSTTSQGSVGFTLGRFTGDPFNLDLRLSAGEIQGMTRIVSTPKISVLDNQEAKIEQGETIPYQTSSPNQGTQTTFVDANLTLSVKPHITGDGSIIMNMKVTKNAPGGVRPGASGPSIFKKEATTNVLLKDGETTVIGGIYETNKTTTVAGVPFLMRIPILGWLFKNEEEREDITELLVFITPRILL